MPEPLEMEPTKGVAPDLTDAGLPGCEAAHMQIPPLKYIETNG